MNCPHCSCTVPANSKFCEECGTPLPRACALCGHGNSLKAKFCAECGANLADSAPAKRLDVSTASRTANSSDTAVAAERRQLTVMFCDMVGSSALSTRLDPEEQRDVVGVFQSCCATEIKRLGGMVAQYLGDGVLAYFGYPSAHEDDAERAVRSGLAVLDSVGCAKLPVGVAIQARIGIAS